MYKKYYPKNMPSTLQYWQDENGNDWYDYADNASKDNLKVLTNENGMVMGFSVDATALFPENCNLHEVPFEKVPKGLEIVKYSYDGNEFSKIESSTADKSSTSIEKQLLYYMLKDELSTEEKKHLDELKKELISAI